jgi:hypothetical protein
VGEIIHEIDLTKEAIDSMIKSGYLEAVNEFKKIETYENKMIDSIDKCFVGRISRLINCLNGFDPRVIIEIDIKEQIRNIIGLIQMKLENNNEYTIEKHSDLAIEALRERNIDEETIKLWISYIE